MVLKAALLVSCVVWASVWPVSAKAQTSQALPAPLTPTEIVRIRAALTAHFADPSSLQFADVTLRRIGQAAVLCGHVNAKNRMGAYNGFAPFIVIGADVTVYDGRPGTRRAFERMQQLTCNAAPSVPVPLG